MRDVVAGFERGRILIGVLGHPYKCPPAPFEGALLLHDQLTQRGVRGDCEIRVIGPMAAPVPVTAEVSQAFLSALGERDISYVGKETVASIDPGAGEAQLASGDTVPYDLFIGVPVHRVPEVVASSGLAPDGWIPVDPDNLATSFDGVYALGDCTALPMAKAGVFAENAGRRRRRGHHRDPPRRRARASLRGDRQLLPRVRRGGGRQGRGQLPRRARPHGPPGRPEPRACRGEGGVRRDPQAALVRRRRALRGAIQRDVSTGSC